MKFLLSSLIILAGFTLSIEAQDTLSYTKNEVIYGRKDGMALTMFVLAPKKNAIGKGIISVVSGNWVSSFNYASYLVNRAKLYADKGYTVFVVMHGSQPRYTITDEVVDLKRAVRFIRYNAGEYHIDANHIGITGSSSGGNLSLLVALADEKIDTASKDPVDRVSGRVQAAAVFYPPTDFLNWGQTNTTLTSMKPLLAAAGVASAFEFKEWSDSTKTYRIITDNQKLQQLVKQNSPIYAVSSDDPPVLIVHGDADKVVPLQQSETIIKQLDKSNVPNKLIIKKGGGHGWANSEAEEQNFVDWFNKYLK